MAVMRAESGCNPNAFGINTNGTDDVGLFQINSVHVPKRITNYGRYDLAENIKVAYQIYRSSGWKAWVAYKTGKHIKYLQQ